MHIDHTHMYARARYEAAAFRTSAPYPHAVFDDFLPRSAYEALVAAFPAPEHEGWKRPDNAHTQGKSVTRANDEDGLKESVYSEDIQMFLLRLNGGRFLHFLSLLTGIDGLLPDPYFAEGGFHQSEDGGFLDVHADFSHHDRLGLERRVNLLLYLNDGWRPEYRGALHLCAPDLTPVRVLQPIGNRCVIFETSETSYHGHPEPMALPHGVYRRSLALYYYSVPRPSRERQRIVFPTDRSFVHEVTR